MNTEQSQARSLHWFKSSHSGGEGGECVEVAALPHSVHIRDSKDTGRGFLTVSPASWSAFVAHTGRRHRPGTEEVRAFSGTDVQGTSAGVRLF